MTITDRNLPAGTLLKATHKKAAYLAEIKSYQDERNLTLEVLEGSTELAGRQFNSLSKAAMAITGNSVNGWRFWTIAGEPPEAKGHTMRDGSPRLPSKSVVKGKTPGELGEEAARQDARVEEVAGIDQPTAAADAGFGNGGVFTADAKRTKRQRTFTPIKRTAQQGGVAEGATRMWCHGCQGSFIASGDVDGYKHDDARCPNGHRVGDMREAALGVERIEGSIEVDANA